MAAHFHTINPATGEILEEYSLDTPGNLKSRLAAGTPGAEESASALLRLADGLDRHRADLARQAALEMGKPLTQGEGEVAKCAATCRWFAENAETLLQPPTVEGGRLQLQPLGRVLGIMPWNFPYWQILRFAVPALLAGNSVLIKPALNTAGCALKLASLFEAAGFGEDRYLTALLDDAQAEAMVAQPGIAAVSLTGSTRAGRAVAAAAGQALKKCVLELGGSDPYLVLADADLDLAATTCVNARLVNSGQTCVAAKRFIVEAAVLDTFREKAQAALEAKTVGDPASEGTDVGPLAREDLRDQLHRQVTNSVAAGARCLMGGEIPTGRGWYYPVTLLDGVKPGMPAFDDETFGPLACIIEAKDTAHALELANQSRYGLGAAVFTKDKAKADGLARDLQCGQVFINGPVVSDPRLPFGGIKESGWGRELSALGLREFTNIKTVVP